MSGKGKKEKKKRDAIAILNDIYIYARNNISQKRSSNFKLLLLLLLLLL
jgi:hypothetical protein